MSNEVINDILVKAIEAATATGEFLGEQVPLLVQELVIWNIAAHSLGAVAFFIIACILASLSYFKGIKDNDMDGFMFPMLGQCVALPFLFYNLYELIKWTIAPRVALLEYAASLVR